MKVTINGVERDWEFDGSATLHDAIIEIGEKLLIDDKLSISELQLGDMDPEVDRTLTPKDVPAAKIYSLNITTEPLKESLLRDIGAAEGHFKIAREKFESIPTHVLAGENDIAMMSLKESLDVLIWFFNLLQQAFAAGFIEPQALLFDGDDVAKYTEKFNEKLQDLMKAIERRDQVLINDYIEYELAPAVANMMDALPEIIGLIEAS